MVGTVDSEEGAVDGGGGEDADGGFEKLIFE